MSVGLLFLLGCPLVHVRMRLVLLGLRGWGTHLCSCPLAAKLTKPFLAPPACPPVQLWVRAQPPGRAQHPLQARPCQANNARSGGR